MDGDSDDERNDELMRVRSNKSYRWPINDQQAGEVP